MQSSTVTGVSPSFTSYSSNNLADIAARVVEEFRHENGDDYDDIFNHNHHPYDHTKFSVPADEKSKDDKDFDTVDDEFEFAVVNSSSISISANEIFSQGHILPRYPLFDRSLLLDVDPDLLNVFNRSAETDCNPSLVVRLPLRKLFSEERDFASSSSSEADDLDGVNPGTYCVWKPKADQSPGRCKKSNSTGNSSNRWKFRDILYRSNSDGKEIPFLFFKPKIATNKKVKKVEKTAEVAATVGEGASAVATTEERGSWRRSYLPSGQTLIGAFTTVNRSNRNLRPF